MTYRVPKAASSDAIAGAHPIVDATPQMQAGITADQADPAAAKIAWTLPSGWTTKPPGQVQYAAFQPVADDPSVAVTIVPMPLGQAMLPNVNRWEEQVGLPKSDQAHAESKLSRIDVAGVPVRRISLVGVATDKPAQSIEAAFAEVADCEWFFKMQGPSEKVAALRPSFDAFIASIRFGPSAAAQSTVATGAPMTSVAGSAVAAPMSSTPGTGAGPADDGPLAWNVPGSWVAEPAKPMRMASWQAGTGADAAEIVVSQFATGSFGDMTSNVNRWRAMAGLAPVTDAAASPPEHLRVGTGDVDVYDFAGTGAAATRVRVALVPTPDGRSVYFFRLQGSVAAVSREQAAFDPFVQSVRFKQ